MDITAKRNAKYTLERLLGISSSDNLILARKIERGLSYDSLERFRKITGLPIDQLRMAVRLTPRTLSRRKQERKLSPAESDRLISISRLMSLTFELFEGQMTEGLRWFTEPNRALGGLAPIEAAATETGSREVENLIGRLEHGVFV